MIVTRLNGRLGNQMFQYAAARGLAERLGVPVALDTREVTARGEGVLTRVFDLEIAAPDHLPPARKARPLAYLAWRVAGGRPPFRREQGLGYNVAIEGYGDGSYLHGYWQSERYFDHIADRIRRDFAFPRIADTRNAEMAERIGKTDAVSLHVRRGDYVALDAHGLCNQAYYESALARIIEGMQAEPTVFVFSDDPDWARENLPLPCRKVVVDFNAGAADFEDMRLMSLCDHNIIANSSFSWWGAWLNTNPAKRVAGPARWFGDAGLQNPDILPPDWLRID